MGGGEPHVAVSDTGCSSGVGNIGHSARRYCTVAGHYSRSSQPAALIETVLLGYSQILRKVMSSVYTAMMV